MKYIQLMIFFLYIVVSYSETSVKLELSVTLNQMTLTCLVKNRMSGLNIYLQCPLATTCKENCKHTCNSDEKCIADQMIECNDIGFDKDNGFYKIEYVISGTDIRNNGKWNCSYGSTTSSSISVDVVQPKKITSKPSNFITITKPTKTLPKPNVKGISTKRLPTNKLRKAEYVEVLKKTEFILSVIGLLAVSLFFNIIFCSRILIMKCKLKKPAYGNNNYFSMQQNQRPSFNRCNSHASDPERIYEDTSGTMRQMSFLTKIKNANGNYVGQSTLTPSSGPPTLLPPNYLPINHSMTFPNLPHDGSNQLLNTPTQMYFPLPSDPNTNNFGTLGENQYTNFVSVQPELNNRDSNNQPLYLAFTPGHPFISANSRYLQYSNQPMQMTTESSHSSYTKPSPVPSQMKNGLLSRSDSEQDNYKLSREMMEEADNLLRTADNLLKSTQKEMEVIQ